MYERFHFVLTKVIFRCTDRHVLAGPDQYSKCQTRTHVCECMAKCCHCILRVMCQMVCHLCVLMATNEQTTDRARKKKMELLNLCVTALWRASVGWLELNIRYAFSSKSLNYIYVWCYCYYYNDTSSYLRTQHLSISFNGCLFFVSFRFSFLSIIRIVCCCFYCCANV